MWRQFSIIEDSILFMIFVSVYILTFLVVVNLTPLVYNTSKLKQEVDAVSYTSSNSISKFSSTSTISSDNFDSNDKIFEFNKDISDLVENISSKLNDDSVELEFTINKLLKGDSQRINLGSFTSDGNNNFRMTIESPEMEYLKVLFLDQEIKNNSEATLDLANRNILNLDFTSSKNLNNIKIKINITL